MDKVGLGALVALCSTLCGQSLDKVGLAAFLLWSHFAPHSTLFCCSKCGFGLRIVVWFHLVPDTLGLWHNGSRRLHSSVAGVVFTTICITSILRFGILYVAKCKCSVFHTLALFKVFLDPWPVFCRHALNLPVLQKCSFADSPACTIAPGALHQPLGAVQRRSQASWVEWLDWMRSFMGLSNAPELRALSFNLTTNPPDS